MEGESGVTRSIIDKLHSLDIQGDQMEGESGVPRCITGELHSWELQGDQMEGESGVTRSLIDELHSSDMIKWKVKVVLPEVSLMSFFLRISNEIK